MKQLSEEQWQRRYIDTLIEIGSLTEEEALECFDAGLGEHDYTDDPEEAANEEMSYRNVIERTYDRRKKR